METERRKSVRKRTDQLLYAEFGPDNGSVLLNLGEEGCSFQSIAPVRGEYVRFSLSVGDGRKLEGRGQMVWSDPANKVGGLHFLNPSAELRDQVREWLEEALVTADGELDRAAVESQEKKRRRKKLTARAELMSSEVTLNVGKGGGGPLPEVELAPISVVDGTGVIGSKDPRKIWRGVSVIAFAIMVCVALVAYRREVGHLVVSFGSTIAGDQQKHGIVAPAEGAVSDSPIPEAQPIAVSDTTETSIESSADAAPASAEELTGAGEAPVKHVASKQRILTQDVPSLWTSVENGDTVAEVSLASRYVRGDGVPQSCAQARVLLEAAVKRGSAVARQKLAELGQAGCP